MIKRLNKYFYMNKKTSKCEEREQGTMIGV